MKKVMVSLLVLAAFVLAAKSCVNVSHNAVILIDSLTQKIYPKLKVGMVLKNDVLVDNVTKLLPDYTGWLPAALVKVNQAQAASCKKAGLPLYNSCSGSTYCLVPINGIAVYIYHGNFTKKLFEVFGGMPKGMGNPKSSLWVIELLDPFCPYCARFYLEGGGRLIETWAKEGKIYMIPVMIAFHTYTKGYNQSLALAYVQQELANGNETQKFFDLEHKIIANLEALVNAKKELVNIVNVVKEYGLVKQVKNETQAINALKGWYNEQMMKAHQLFPTIATPTTILLNPKTGKAIAVMGAQSSAALVQVARILGVNIK
ncbi:hypothetical protein IPA_04295 [Ignicoccus pacificus DSM 13166]|uniref:Thioredoxin-like fold domain-containing protein n=1 Tax=Ignicoccus pacificus DSM 13166 TaxID=940294 RepID=A0A977PLD7_9CREN|nr:hypothetical protein IPA_04295 [Ignicoccus pacificus DSM 13166]